MLGTSAAMKLSLSSTIFIQSSCFKPIHFDLLPNKTRECDEATLNPCVLHILMTYNDERNFFLGTGYYAAVLCVY